MSTVGLVSAGFMGSGLGAALREGGARVITTLEGRSARTARLATQAGLELLPSLAEVIAAADIVLSVTPPGSAVATAKAIAAQNRRRPTGDLIVADLNAVSPTTMVEVAEALTGVRVIDGSISGPPPTVRPGARLYLSGPDAAMVADLPWSGQVEPIVLGDRMGSASALKMCTGSVYKGLTALITQSLRMADAHGVLDEVLADLGRNGLADVSGVARSATKAARFVDEMREVAATQQAAGLPPDLFTAIADVYATIARTPLADADPEDDRTLTPAEIAARLRE